MLTNTTVTTNHSAAVAPPSASTSLPTSNTAGILEEASPSQEIEQEHHDAQTTGATAVGVNHHRFILLIGPQIPVQNILPSEGGLHLPRLPSSTVGVVSTIGMGYNIILVDPPHQPTVGARHISQRTVSRQHSSNQRQELDAFFACFRFYAIATHAFQHRRS